MASLSLFSFFLLLFLTFLLIIKASAWAPAKSPDPTTHLENSTRFIRISCQSTLYPDLCFSSLSRYAPSIHQSPVALTRAAARLSRSQIHSAASHISRYNGSRNDGIAAALKDCVDFLADAADRVKRSMSEIWSLSRRGVAGPEVAWRASNVQTWMSAALTDKETCTDGFDQKDAIDQSDEDGDEQVLKNDVLRRLGRAKMYTSNALALVNCLVNGDRPDTLFT